MDDVPEAPELFGKIDEEWKGPDYAKNFERNIK
jgi:hypothetical protein